MENNRAPVRQSKIVKYKLEDDCVSLRKAGLSYNQIAEELNGSGKIPGGDSIDKHVLKRFFAKLPEIQQEIVRGDKQRLVEVVNTNMDIVYEVSHMYERTKILLESMEEDAISKGRYVNPYQYKAVISEMREMIKQMTDIQREINDFDNVRMFMSIILDTIKEEAPDTLPLIVDKLNSVKGTQWFSGMFK